MQQTLAGEPFAILLDTQQTTLKPFGAAQLRLQCLNSCPGTYTARLHCAVGEQPVRTLDIRAGVFGTAIHMQTASNLLAGLSEAQQTKLAVPFGTMLRGRRATRHFSLFNVSGAHAEVQLQLKLVPLWPQQRNIAVQLTPNLDGHVSLQIKYASACCINANMSLLHHACLTCSLPGVRFLDKACMLHNAPQSRKFKVQECALKHLHLVSSNHIQLDMQRIG